MTDAALNDKNLRPMTTPDGVPLNLVIANYGERASALMLDLLFMGLIFGGLLLLGLILGPALQEYYFVLLFLAFFALRSFYFIFFEIRWHGMTPGKRIVGLRVIDRKGDVLEPEAIFARNLMREIELWIPMMLFIFQAEVGLESLYLVLNAIWMGIFVLMPFFNKDRLRAGDMIGGTLVIRAPKTRLLSDPVKSGMDQVSDSIDLNQPTFSFTQKQLDIYGIFELQTLEKVLRSHGQDREDIFVSVAENIIKKIDYETPPGELETETFLRDFYMALRKHHEGRLLFGRRKKDKFDVKAPPREEQKEPQKKTAGGSKTQVPRLKRRRRR